MTLDLMSGTASTSILWRGLLDEPAHLLTAAIVLSALPWSVRTEIWWWALAGSVLIDLDHVPLYTFAPEFSVAGGRPPTHSLATVLALLAIAAATPPFRKAFLGLATGICLHLIRDVATGPGVPLLWPLSDNAVRVAYPLYLTLLGVAAAVIIRQRWGTAPHQ